MDSTVVAADMAAEATGNMKTFTTLFVFVTGVALAQAPKQKTFDSPEAAAQSLIDAASKNDTAMLGAVLGSTAEGMLTSGNAKQDEAEREQFAKIATAKHHLERSSMNSHVRILLIGDQDWPFPVPLVEQGKQWHFDSARGTMELRARQLGANELDAIQACAAYVSAQQSYAESKRSAAGTGEYAQNIANLAVPHEFAEAAGQNSTVPYRGYYFRTLKVGRHAYVAGGAMIGGFAIVAWPAKYGVTGIHTFVVNQDGVVYEKDRGARPAAAVMRYDPDASWLPVD